MSLSSRFTRQLRNWALFSFFLLVSSNAAMAADSLTWESKHQLVSADIRSSNLFSVLEKIAGATGWHVYVEPDTAHTVSTKFKDLPPGEALHMLLGNVNFMLVPTTNASSKLFVFRTSMRNATQLVKPDTAAKAKAKLKVIPKELVVRLKPGVNIDQIARIVGAKVIGKIDNLNAYRLQFDTQEAADAARIALANSPDVASVESNYQIDRPPIGDQALPGTPAQPSLKLDPPPDGCAVLVGLVDTSVQTFGNNLDQLVTKRISVAGNPGPSGNTPLHGTSMLETLANSLAMASKGSVTARVISADVYGPNASTSTFDVANGIAQVINAGAKIVNLSLGSDADSELLHSVIQDAAAQNILFIGAAGNTPVTTPFYPAAYPEVNAVTAVDQGQLAPYANRGSFITLGAPGDSVVNYQNQSWMVEGTSSSAAFTSGLAAAYLQSNPCATAASSQAFLRSNLGVTIGGGQ